MDGRTFAQCGKKGVRVGSIVRRYVQKIEIGDVGKEIHEFFAGQPNPIVAGRQVDYTFRATRKP